MVAATKDAGVIVYLFAKKKKKNEPGHGPYISSVQFNCSVMSNSL